MNEGAQPPGPEPGPQCEPDDVLQRVDDVLSRAMPGLQPEPTGRARPEYPNERETVADSPEPRIYVASLSDYNAGRLHGRWIDANQSVEDIETEIQEMLAVSPEPDAEEWAIHDYDGFGVLHLHEYEALEFVGEVAGGIGLHGEAFAAFVVAAERHRERFVFFEDLYQGTWESVETYGRSLVEEQGVQQILDQLPEWVRPYVHIDFEGLAQALAAGGVLAVDASGGGVYVFDLEG